MNHLITTPPHPHPHPYLTAKHHSYNLLAELHLTIANHAYTQLHREVAYINTLLSNCNQSQRGEVFLIMCMAIIQLPQPTLSLYLPQDYDTSINHFLGTLVETGVDRGEKAKGIKQAYSGKLKKSAFVVQQRKRSIMDFLFVDRIDKVLVAIINSAKLERKRTFKGFNPSLLRQLQKSITLAKNIFSQTDYEEYKSNIAEIVEGVSWPELGRGQSQRGSSVGKFMIIDESLATHQQIALAIRKSSSNRLVGSLKGSVRYNKVEKAASIAQSIDSSRKNEGLSEKKCPNKRSNSKRGSLSSNYSKRSSGFNRSEDRIGEKSGGRWAHKVNTEIMNSFNKNKPIRRSNFNRPIDYAKDEIPFITKINPIIEEQANNDKQTKAENIIHDIFVQAFLKTSRKIKDFYIYLRVEEAVLVGTVEEVKDSEGVWLEDEQEQKLTKLRIQVMNPTKVIITFALPHLHFSSLSKELLYLKTIQKQVELTKHPLGAISASIKQADCSQDCEDQEGCSNILQVRTSAQRMLFSFIRKISTHFVCVCMYQREDITNHYEPSFKRKLLSEKKPLRKAIPIQRQLKSTDLTMDFKVEAAFSIKKGSAIQYIEQQQSQSQGQHSVNEEVCLKTSQNIMREVGEVSIKAVWQSERERHKAEQAKSKKLTRNPSRMHNKYTERDAEGKRIKRRPTNKNSIKMMTYLPDMEGLSMGNNQFFRTHQMHNFSKKELNPSEKRISEKHKMNKKKEKVQERHSHFIETIKTDKGYQLIMHKEKREIRGYEYQSYLGYRERNPRVCCFEKGLSSSSTTAFYKPTLTIHGNKDRTVPNTHLITFTKMVNIDSGFGGFVVSSIRIMPNSANSNIFIETYWQAKQKYFIFVVSAQIFQKLTDINTKNFQSNPFLVNQSSQQKMSKKRDKRTSLMKEKDLELIKHASSNFKKRDSMEEIPEANESFILNQLKQKGNQSKTNQTVTKLKTLETYSTTKNMKHSQRSQLRREVIMKLKNKLVKYACFVWKDYRLLLQLKHNLPTQLESISLVELQGSELALKNVYSHPSSDQLEATELILVKYRQDSLANLNFYPMEAITKIYLEHTFIKNSGELYGRYTSFLNIKDVVQDQRLSLNYKYTNKFFEPKEQVKKIVLKHIRILSSRTSTIEEQRKVKYQEIIGLAQKCSISLSLLKTKKRKIRAKKFIIPNKYTRGDPLLQLELKDEQVFIRDFNGETIHTISIEKLTRIFPYLSKVPLSTFLEVLRERILRDEQLLFLCGEGSD